MGLQPVARDLARFGQLIVNGGKRGSSQILSTAWIDDETDSGGKWFQAEGSFGQFVTTSKRDCLVGVRMGYTPVGSLTGQAKAEWDAVFKAMARKYGC
jgi:CubicO group peptidase (beta-lactamase class C family)